MNRHTSAKQYAWFAPIVLAMFFFATFLALALLQHPKKTSTDNTGIVKNSKSHSSTAKIKNLDSMNLAIKQNEKGDTHLTPPNKKAEETKSHSPQKTHPTNANPVIEKRIRFQYAHMPAPIYPKHINTVLTTHGINFTADINELKNFNSNEIVELSILGKDYSARVKETYKTDQNNHYISLTLNPNSQIADMMVFYGKKLTKGKIYSAQNSYIFEHNGQTGFIMPLSDYERKTGISSTQEATR